MRSGERWGIALMLMAIVLRLDADLLGMAFAATGFVVLINQKEEK